MSARIALISCVKSKHNAPSPARDLYTSTLFNGMRKYAEHNADAWFILSAEYGLLTPDQLISPYEKTLNRMPKAGRVRWADRVQQQLIKSLPSGATVIILAGDRYRER